MLRRIIILAPAIAFVCAVQTGTLQAAAFTISQPMQFGYNTSLTTPIPIPTSGPPPFPSVPSISAGGLTVTFAPTMVELSIPAQWASWGIPPATELNTAACPGLGINCPPVLWSNGSASVTMFLSTPESVFGFEAEPDNPAAEPMLAQFYMVGVTTPYPIPLSPSGDYGALLFAVSSTVPITKVVLTSQVGDDFAIANVRFSATPLNPSPESGSVVLVGTALCGLGVWKLKKRWPKHAAPPLSMMSASYLQFLWLPPYRNL
jgi:hypothetical protein